MSDPITRLNAALEGRYRVEREIGEGGMATVYLAEDLRHERKVALKVLKPELAAVVGAERFLAEIKTTANLQHPHILPLFDSGEADGFLFFVAPYIEGDTLRDKIDREKQLGIEEALDITKKVASALDYAHKHAVVHRDIKPGNILLSEEGEPIVADFGIALAVAQAGGGRVTETGLSVGTPHYMSPEQATGDRDVDPRTDVYALGCVLYEMLVGEPPYSGTTAQAVLAKILTDPAPAPTRVRGSIPPNVDAAIRKALEKLPADRFTSAQDFAGALGDPGFRHREGLTAGITTGAGRWNGLSMATTASTVVLALALGWALLRSPPPQPVLRFELTVPDDIRPQTANGVGLAVSPDGSQVVFVGQMGAGTAASGGGAQLWRRPLDQLTPTAIPGTQGARNPRFSPDGTSVAFTGGASLTTASLTGGPPLTVVSDSVPNGNGGLAWAPDGNLYFRKFGLGIWRVSENGGEEEEVTTLDQGEAGHLWLDALPNGRGLLFTRDIGSPADDEIAVVSLETGEIRVLFQGAMARYAHSGHIVYASGEGTLFAAPFDVDALEVTGPSRSLLEGVLVLGGSPALFALSETGSLVYRPGSAAGTTPVWVSRDGSEEILDPTLTGSFRVPAISPEGSRVAFEYTQEGASDIWIYYLDQGTFSRLTFEGNNRDPFWRPDGSEVGFASTREGLGGLFARPADLSGNERLLVEQEDGQPLFDGGWTPDERWIVYQRGGGSASDLMYAAADPDSTPVEFLATPLIEGDPSISPNGRWLAYHANDSGVYEVYVSPFPGPGGRTLISTGGGQNPVWAHNGREIFYRGTGQSLIIATVRTEPDVAVESREELTSWAGHLAENASRHFDPSPEDERLLSIRAVDSSGGEMRDIVVQNFFEELRQVVPD